MACQHFISNRTNHKLRKKLANKKTPTYVLATLWDSNTILCTNLQTLYTERLECLRHRLQFIPISKIPWPAAVNLKSSQIFSFVVPFPSKPHPTPQKKLSLPIRSPNRIDSDLTGNKKIVSLWQAESEICRSEFVM